MRIYKLEENSYESECFLIIGSDSEVGEYLYKKYKLRNEFEHNAVVVDGYHFKMMPNETADRKIHYCIVLKSKPKKIYEFGMLSHELLHMVFSILGDIGMVHSKESEEAYTYLYQRLFIQAIRKLP